MNIILATLLLLLAPLSAVANGELVNLTDPAGDDFGSGSLRYPERPDFRPGDLDLRSLRVSAEPAGFWFEASFANPIRDPRQANTGVGPEPMPVSARHGFYTFNLDIYIDTDRLAGSGNQFTLPGRGLRIAPGYAWERAIILTPRPELARSELFDGLSRQFPEHSLAAAEASVAQAVFFPSEVRVRGRSVAFFVPRAFMGSSDGSDWGLTAMVTGAKPYSSMSIAMLPTGKTPLEELDLGAMQPAPGRPTETFGIDKAMTASPIVDLLLPSIDQQVALLAGNAPLSGVSWGAHAVSEPPASHAQSAADSATRHAPREGSGGSLIANTWGSLKSLFGGKAEVAAPAAVPTEPPPIRTFLDPQASSATNQPAPPDTRPVQTHFETRSQAPAGGKPTVAERLRALKEIHDDQLIDDAEFKQQKQRILDDL